MLFSVSKSIFYWRAFNQTNDCEENYFFLLRRELYLKHN